MSVFESYWANKAACDDAERAYYEKLSGCKVTISLYHLSVRNPWLSIFLFLLLLSVEFCFFHIIEVLRKSI